MLCAVTRNISIFDKNKNNEKCSNIINESKKQCSLSRYAKTASVPDVETRRKMTTDMALHAFLKLQTYNLQINSETQYFVFVIFLAHQNVGQECTPKSSIVRVHGQS